MAHTITTQILENGTRDTCIKVNIKGDGASGELAAAIIFDASAYKTGSVDNKLMRVDFCLNGFSAELFWKADTDVALISMDQDISEDMHYDHCGGLINNGGTGRNGDILITTTGLSATTEDGYIVFHIKQRNLNKVR